MRRIGWLPPPIAAGRSAVFSTFSGGGGGGGRGRGRGGGFVPPPPLSPSQPDPYSADDDGRDSFSSGAGHGRGSLPVLPSFLSPSPSPLGRGRGRGGGGVVTHPTTTPPPPPPPETLNKKPIFFRQTEPEPERGTGKGTLANEPSKFSDPDDNENPQPLPLPGLSSGGGRGMPLRPPPAPAPAPDASAEPNRHVRSRKPIGAPADGPSAPVQPKMNREDAVKKAMEVLSRGRGGGGPGRGEGRGMARGRGRGMGARGRGGRGRGGREREEEEEEDYWGDPADAEKVEKRLGADKMKLLEEGFDEMSWRVLPPPLLDEFFNAWDTNNMIEYEPEYLVEFDKNPDIDEKPPISLEEALEKAKPFLVAYEGIQSQEEWEEVIKETMEKLPVMKELIDSYCGPDRVTAKQQQQELERVAKTLPENVPSSVKRFTERAVLSLQSNPGWGFDKKCQFMDKLVWEVTQHYK